MHRTETEPNEMGTRRIVNRRVGGGWERRTGGVIDESRFVGTSRAYLGMRRVRTRFGRSIERTYDDDDRMTGCADGGDGDRWVSFSSPCVVLFALSGARRDGRMNGSRARGSRDPKKRYGGRSPPAGGLDGLVSYTQKPWVVCVCV